MPNSSHENIATPNACSNVARSRSRDRSRQQDPEELDGSQPLGFPAHEALAQHLSSPKSVRQFKSDSDLAAHFKITRMTVFRWKREPDVIERALWLSMKNKLAGELIVRVEWPEIVERAVAMAKGGNVRAMEFCFKLAWPNNAQIDDSIEIDSLFAAAEMDEPQEGGELKCE